MALTLPEGTVFMYGTDKRTGAVMKSHHYHSNKFELYYMTSGECSYFIDDKTYEVTAGDLVIIPEGAIHKTVYGKDEHSRMLIECSSVFMPVEVREAISNMSRLYRNPSLSREIFLHFKRIEEEYTNPDEFSYEALLAHMRLLFYTIVRGADSATMPHSKNQMVDEVVGYVKKNFSSEISLSAMAKMHFVSSEHLSRTFKRETGFGFSEYLTIVRLRQAEYLLKNREDMSISEIAYTCGFNDSNYFSDKFKKAYGTSPLKYSKSFKK